MAVEGENLGVATIYVTVDTATMEAGIAKSKLTLAGMGSEAQKQYDAMSAGQQKVAVNLARQIELMGKSTAQQKAYYAQQKLGGALGADLAKQALAQEQALTAAREEEATSAQKIIAAEAEARAAQQARYDSVMAQEREIAAAYAVEAEARRAAIAPVDTGLTPVAVGSSAVRAGDPRVVQQIADYAALDAIMGKKAATTAEVAAAEAALDRLQAQGMISNEELAESFAALDVVTAAETKSLQANSVAQVENAAATKVNSRTQYELGVLLGETASGNTSRIKRSIPALMNSMHLTEKLFTPLGAGIAIAAAAVVTFGIAAFKGEEQTAAFNKALLATGNASGASIQSLEGMTQALGKLDGSYGDARAAVLAMASSGKVSDAAMQQSAQSALDYAKVTGVSMKQAVAAIVSLGDDPVKALEKLDSSYHFLTAAVLGEVEALQDAGENAQATAVAEKAFADANGQRAKEVVEHLGWLQEAADATGHFFSKMWDAIEGVGRAPTFAEQLAPLQARIKGIASLSDKEWGSAYKAQATAVVQAQIKAIQDKMLAGSWNTYDSNMAAAQEKDFQSAVDGLKAGAKKYEDASKKAAEQIAKVNKQLAAAIAGDPAHADLYRQQAQTSIAGIRAALAKHQPKGGAPKDNSDKLRQMALDDFTKDIAAQGKLNDAQAKGAAQVAAFNANLDSQLQTRKQVLALQVASVGMGTKEAQQQQELLTITQQYNSKQEQLDREHADKSRGMTDAEYAQESADLKKHYDADTALTKQYYAQMDTAQGDWWNGAASAIANFHDQAADVAGQTATVFNTAFSDMTDALMTFVTTGKLSFKSLVTDVLKGIAEMELKAAESKLFSLVGNMIASYFGGGIADNGSAGYAGYTGSTTATTSNTAVGFNALGNVFAGPGIAAYENQIVSKPTFFARGGNVMGEAGPEAIIPLSRDSGGRLGIKSAGGGNTININTQVTVDQSGARSKTSSDSSDAAARQLGAMMEAKAKEVVGRAIQPGGILWRHGVGQAA